jgi:hypothetical protein
MQRACWRAVAAASGTDDESYTAKADMRRNHQRIEFSAVKYALQTLLCSIAICCTNNAGCVWRMKHMTCLLLLLLAPSRHHVKMPLCPSLPQTLLLLLLLLLLWHML